LFIVVSLCCHSKTSKEFGGEETGFMTNLATVLLPMDLCVKVQNPLYFNIRKCFHVIALNVLLIVSRKFG
jgi:hypothetical protein